MARDVGKIKTNQNTQLVEAWHGMPDGLFALDLTNGDLIANPACSAILDCIPEELPPTLAAWMDRVHPDDREIVLAAIAAYDRGGSGHAIHVRIQTKAGEWRAVLCRGQALQSDAAGRPLRIAGTLLDLTDHRWVHPVLGPREETWRSVIDAMPDGVAVYEMLYAPDGTPQDYRLLAANAAAARYAGAPQDPVGRTGADLSGLSPPPSLELYDRAARRGDAAEYETGGPHSKQVRVSVFPAGEGRFATVMRDVTDRHTADMAFHQRIEHLEMGWHIAQELLQERQLATVADRIVRAAIELTQAGSATLLLWDTADQLLRTCAWCGSGPWRQDGVFRLGESVAGVAAEHRRAVLDNDARRSRYAHPFFSNQSSATAMLAEPLMQGDRLLGVLMCDNEGTGRPFTASECDALAILSALAARVLVFAEADAVRAETDRRRAGRDTLRALGDMADGVAHDLNNRLAAIVGFVELLKLRGHDPDENLHRLDSAVTDAVAVVRRFQMFARQRSTGPLAVVDLRAAIDAALQDARGRWKELDERQRTIAVQCVVDDLPAVLGDVPGIREVLANVIANAVEAMPEGGSLTFAGGAASAEAVILHISDTGIGMSEGVRQKAFEPFFTTKGGRGSGLGLAIAYGVMERLGGHIDIASTPGRGTTVTLQFQQAPMSASAERSLAQRISPADDNAVLFVAAGPDARASRANLLRAAGLTVIAASDVSAALVALGTTKVAVVLVDASQRTAVQALKSAHPRIPVVLLSRLDTGAVTGVRPAGVDRVISTSAPLEDVLCTIRELAVHPR